MATKKSGKVKVNSEKLPPPHVPTRPVVVDAAHCWLERTNPLVGVSIRTAQNIWDAASIRTAQNIWDAARAGDTQRLHWLFNEIESANPVLFTCIERRQAAIAGFQLKVSALPSMEGGLADEQKDAVEIENFTEMLEHLDSAFFRGFALAQPIWEEDATVREIRLHNSWEFLVHDGVLYHNPECNGFTRDAVSCADAGLIGIQRRRAIDYPALSIHIRHAVSERDWGRFLERYALPKPAVTMAPNATNEQRKDYLDAARAVENGQVSVWPSGSSITDFAGGSRGTDPFNTFIEHQEKLIVLLATGGTLTSPGRHRLSRGRSADEGVAGDSPPRRGRSLAGGHAFAHQAVPRGEVRRAAVRGRLLARLPFRAQRPGRGERRGGIEAGGMARRPGRTRKSGRFHPRKGGRSPPDARVRQGKGRELVANAQGGV